MSRARYGHRMVMVEEVGMDKQGRHEEKQTMARRETLQVFDDDAVGTISPIQLVRGENLHEIPAPLARISTCGGLNIEVLEEVISLDPPQGRYVLLTPRHLRKQHKGYRTGMGLLKVLSSQPGYF